MLEANSGHRVPTRPVAIHTCFDPLLFAVISTRQKDSLDADQ